MVTNLSLGRSRSGFSLVEVMIVLAIIGGIIGLGLPRLLNKKENFSPFIRKLTVLSKEIRTRAKLKDSMYRMVFQLNEKSPDSVWVEISSQKVLLSAEDLRKEREKLADEEQKKNKDTEAEGPSSPFTISKDIIREPIEFPENLKVSRIETITEPEPIKVGRAYIHFFPEGGVEKAAIHLTDHKNLNWTLYIHPLTGKIVIIQEDKDLKDIIQ